MRRNEKERPLVYSKKKSIKYIEYPWLVKRVNETFDDGH